MTLILCQELVHKHDTFTLVYGGVTSLLFYFSVLSFVWEVFVCVSVQEEAGPVLDNYRRVGWQISWVGIGGGGGRLDIYTVDIAILTIVCYMYTGEKREKKTFMGSLEYHALELFFFIE